ncbi:MAG: peptidyl-prolyl cis-trans isomerase [Candidatus Subteraquimicrobiales bacterium]|nr:peptidyl-prolyl cis-trans isomerase [Candidatus Subteraquimicrobiales bacterium]
MSFKRWATVAILLSFLFIFVGCGRDGRKIAAVVNGESIYLSQLERRLERYGKEWKGENEKTRRKSILEDIINKKLILQEARRQGITVSQAEVDACLENVKKTFPSHKAFEQALDKMGVTEEEFGEEAEENLMVNKMIDRVSKNIKVTGEEIESYYQKNKEQYQKPEKVKLRWIVLSSQEQVQDVLVRLEGGADFSQLAGQYSIDEDTRDRGGELGERSKVELSPEIAEIAFKLNPREHSQVVRTQMGYVIVQVDERIPPRQKDLEEVESEIRSTLISRKKEEKFRAWLEGLKKEAEIKIYI